jgi:hypothetical protein
MEEQLRAFGNSDERFSKNCFFITINKIKYLILIINQAIERNSIKR